MQINGMMHIRKPTERQITQKLKSLFSQNTLPTHFAGVNFCEMSVETVFHQSSRNLDFEKDAHFLTLGIPAVHFDVFLTFSLLLKLYFLFFVCHYAGQPEFWWMG